MTAPFRPGDLVRVRSVHPPGHLRTPYYVLGCRGVVERACGRYPNPEELAFGRSGRPLRMLYRVRFMQRDLWPDYAGPGSDTVDVELYEHWLQPVTENSNERSP